MAKFTSTLNVDLGIFSKCKIKAILKDIMRTSDYKFYFEKKEARGSRKGAQYFCVSNGQKYFDVVYKNYDTDDIPIINASRVRQFILKGIKELYSD